MIPRVEREELIRVAKMRARVSKSAVAQREAELLAEFEEQLAAHFAPTDEAWREARAEAARAISALNERIQAICDERGVPEAFRPSASLWWNGRGENADSKRRTELRKVATTRIAAAGTAAKVAIEAAQADVITELIAGGLESDEAKGFLERMPTAGQLMPSLTMAEIEAAAAVNR